MKPSHAEALKAKALQGMESRLTEIEKTQRKILSLLEKKSGAKKDESPEGAVEPVAEKPKVEKAKPEPAEPKK